MDIRRVLDQAVREIKREVNLKVFKVPEIEQKVLDATSDEPWGPHGSALAEIARGTRKFSDCQLIMSALWSRLSETDQNWRHIYKALSVIEYLIANGSERALNDIIDHNIQISSLAGFEYVELNGKDVGLNVRKKVETILALLDDRDKITSARDKAAANRDKYLGLSSSGVTYKSGSTSFSSTDSRQYDHYGGTSNVRNKPKVEVINKHKDDNVDGPGGNYACKSVSDRKGEVGHHGRSNSYIPSNTSIASSKVQSASSSKPLHTELVVDDDLDDFNPRAPSTAGSNKVDPFADCLLIDWSDAPSSILTETTSASSFIGGVDFFAKSDTNFGSSAAAQVISQPEENVDLFANQTVESPSSVDLFNVRDPNPGATEAASKPPHSPTQSKNADPFMKISLDNAEELESFGDFTGHSDARQPENSEYPVTHGSIAEAMSAEPPKKATLDIKSGIWADSLSRGLIDLNITAPKKVNLAEIGILGDLEDASNDKVKGHLAPGGSVGGMTVTSGSILDWPAFSSLSAPGTGGNHLRQQQQDFEAFK